MKTLGLALLLGGWIITLFAVVLLKTIPQRAAFVIAGFGVEVLGLALLVRGHLPARRSA